MSGPTALLVAFGSGLLSFLLPCTLPLIPGYLSYISGLGTSEIENGTHRGAMLSAAGLFVLGFSLVFVAFGATASYIGSFLLPYREVLTRVSGAFIIVMALFIVGLVRLPVLYREKRLTLGREFGLWSALPLGMAFAFGWSPCIGPVLSSILAYSATEGTAQKGALLLFCYALGLGIPFLVLAALAEHMFLSVRWLRRYSRLFDLSGGAVLLIMGFFLMFNRWTEVMAPLMRWYAQTNLPL